MEIISVPVLMREAYIICEAYIIASAISSVTVRNGYNTKTAENQSAVSAFSVGK